MSYIIEHKHTAGDTIQFLYSNKVEKGKIKEVQVIVKQGKYPKITETEIKYSVEFNHPTLNRYEQVDLSEVDVFATKQELLDSL